MTDLPDDLRDRAARAALETFHSPRHPYYTFDTTTESYRQAWREIADAVAEVLAGHVGCEHLDGPYRRLVVERDDLRARVERAEAELAHARFVMSQIAEQGCDRFTEPGDLTCIEETQAVTFCGTCIAQQFLSGPAGAHPAESRD